MTIAVYMTSDDLERVAYTMNVLDGVRKTHNGNIRFGPLPVKDGSGLLLGRIISPPSMWRNAEFVPARA